MSKDETYNGWTNWETWCVYTWLSNDEITYKQVCEVIERSRHNPADTIRAWTRHNILSGHASMLDDLADRSFEKVNWQEIASAFQHS